MSDTPELTPPGQMPNPPRRRRIYRTLLKVGAGVGVVAVTLGVVGVIWGDRIVTNLLLPRVADSVDDAIQRPTELGDVTGFTFWGVKLGRTVIPPTETDASSITVEEIEVTVGLRSLIFQQTLKSNIVLVQPQVLLVQGENGKWTDFELPESEEAESRVKVEIQSIEVEDATVRAAPYVDPDAPAIVPREPVLIDETDVTLEFFGEEAKKISFELNGELEDGKFDIDGEANLDKQALKANARLQDLPAKSVNLLLPSAMGIRSGELDGNLNAIAAIKDGTLDKSVTEVKGTAQFSKGEFMTSTLPAPLTNIRSQLLFKGQRVTLEDTGLRLNGTELTASGDVDIDEGYDLTAQIPAISVAEVQALATLDLPIALDGTFQLDAQVTGEFEQPQVRGQLASLQPVLVDQLLMDSVFADFGLTEYAEGVRLPSRFDLNELRVRPSAGGVVIARGQADLRDLEDPVFQLTAEADLPVDAFAQIYGVELPEDIVVGQLVADIQAGGGIDAQTVFAQWQLSEGTFPGTGEVSLIDNLVVIENTRLRSEQGTLAANAVLDLDNGDWQAAANTQQVPMQQFTTQVSGLLDANVRAFGNLDALDLQQIQASGTAFIADAQVRLSETSDSLLDRGDWTTAFEWQGDRVAVDYFTAPGLQANGIIGVDLSQSNPIDRLNLNVALQSFDLQPLNSFAPANVRQYAQLDGLTSFNGQLFGTLENPQIAGDARLDQLAVNDLLFESLAGPVAFSLAEGGRVDLRGQQDRLQIALSDSPGGKIPYWPSSFAIQNQDFIANGYGSGSQLYAEVVQLPLERLDIQPALQYGFGTVGGLLEASVEVNLADFSNPIADGTLKVTQPTLSPIDAKEITASFAYANNTATLKQGELLFDDSRYLLAGSANLAGNIQYEGALTIAEGRVEDLVPIFEKLDLSAFGVGDPPTSSGSAADLATDSVGVPNVPLLGKLESYVAFLETRPEVEDETGVRSLPRLEDLAGSFGGTVAFAGSSLALADATADFDIRGDRWQWGKDTPPNEFSLVGEVEQMGVEIETAFVNAGETQINLSGSGDFDRLDGQLKIENLPVEKAELFYPLPARVSGDLDLAATFGGSLANPIVQGNATVKETVVNDYALEKVAADFNYRNAVLTLDSEIALDPAYAPATINGQVPYALPFMTVQPPTDRLAINAVVPNNSLEVINAFTDGQVLWQSGEGEVSVEVGGTLSQPAVVGLASFKNGTVSSPQLGDDLTGLTGDVRFNLERVDIPQLQANMGEGRLAISGRLPLLPSGQSILGETSGLSTSQLESQSAEGVTVLLEDLPVDYSDILQAVFRGQVLVTGAALSPTVSGNIKVDEGQVQATKLLSQSGSISLPTEEKAEEISPYRVEYLGLDPLALGETNKPKGFLDKVTLQNFDVSFGDRLAILGQPFYNLTALGGLSINGSVSDLQPSGTIELKSGWINIFATQFRLDKDAPNTATFTPETGLNPLVDVVLTARAQEADITPAPSVAGGFANAEINESQVERLGNVEYIKVRAIAQGPASELKDSLTLTSDPPRAERELLALLGSNVFTSVADASYLQVGEFLGAGSLTNFGDRIADVVGLKSFSVAPTTDTGDEGSNGIGLEISAAASLSDRFDVDFQQTLNSSRRPLIGTQYRLTDEIKLRGASNLDETEFELEYRIRF